MHKGFQRAAKGGTQKGQVTFFCFGQLLVTIVSLFLMFLVTFFASIPFCLPLFAAGLGFGAGVEIALDPSKLQK